MRSPDSQTRKIHNWALLSSTNQNLLENKGEFLRY